MPGDGGIWHDVCPTCHPDLDLAICGTELDYDPEVSTEINIEDGQDCVVCEGMICLTCPPVIHAVLDKGEN